MRKIISGLLFVTICPVALLISEAAFHNEYYKERIMSKKYTFYQALEALKEGKSIHRNTKYPLHYVKCDMIIDGKNVQKFLDGFSDRELRETSYFRMEDILADDWIIEEKK